MATPKRPSITNSAIVAEMEDALKGDRLARKALQRIAQNANGRCVSYAIKEACAALRYVDAMLKQK